jgi:hypothetical protein
VAFKGTVRGSVIELDEPLVLPEGTRVHIEIVGIGDPPLPKGSPQLVLQLLAGTLTPKRKRRRFAKRLSTKRCAVSIPNFGSNEKPCS